MLHACTAAAPADAGRDWNNRPLPSVHPAIVRAVGDLRAAAFAQAVVEAYVANGERPIACRKHGPATSDAPPSWTARLGMSRAEFDSVAGRVAVRIRPGAPGAPGADDGAPSRTGAPLVRYWRDGRRTWWQPDLGAWRALCGEAGIAAPCAESSPMDDDPAAEAPQPDRRQGTDDAAFPVSHGGRSGPRLLCDLVDDAAAALLRGCAPTPDAAAPVPPDAPWTPDAAADDALVLADDWDDPDQVDAWRSAAEQWVSALDAWRGVAECWRPHGAPDAPDSVRAVDAEAMRRYDRVRVAKAYDVVGVAAWHDVAVAARVAADAWCGIAEAWRPRDDGGRRPMTPDRAALDAARAAWRAACGARLDSPEAPHLWCDAAVASHYAAVLWWRAAQSARCLAPAWTGTRTAILGAVPAVSTDAAAWRGGDATPAAGRGGR